MVTGFCGRGRKMYVNNLLAYQICEVQLPGLRVL